MSQLKHLHLVEIILPKETGVGDPVGKTWFDELMNELAEEFGGATSFLRSPGQGLWRSGGETKRDTIAVIEVMTERLEPAFWHDLRQRLENDLSQDEIVIRAHDITRL